MKKIILSFRNIFLFFLILTFRYVQAQSLSGVITDAATHEPLPGAAVSLKNTKFQALSSASGYYEFSALTPGKYLVEVHFLGYLISEEPVIIRPRAHEKENVKLREYTTRLHELTIKARSDQGTDISARRKEKKSANLVNVVSAQTIEHSPDLNVADISQRVSGITLDRSTDSKSEFIIIRGMEQRYNTTLLNGIKVPSTDPLNRSVPLEVIPSELVGNLVVSKTLTPDMEGDATGGTVDVQMKDAPSDDLLEVNLSGGYNQTLINRTFKGFTFNTLSRKDPNQVHYYGYPAQPADFNSSRILTLHPTYFAPSLIGGLTFGKRFLKNKLGVLISATNQNFYTGSHSTYSTYTTLTNNTDQVNDFAVRDYSTQTNHTGVNTKLDYIFNPGNKISLVGIYLRTTDDQVRIVTDTTLRGGGGARLGPGTGKIDSDTRVRRNIQELLSLSLQGSNLLASRLVLSWNANYALARSATPDMTEFSVYGTKLPGGQFQDGGVFFNTGGLTHTWQQNKDKDLSAKVDLTYTAKLFQKAADVKIGALFRKKNRDNYNNIYTFDDADIPQSPFRGLASAHVRLQSAFGLGKYNPENYQADEQVTDVYGMTRFNLGPLETTIGVRAEVTSSINHYLQIVQNQPYSVYHTVNYVDVLPSVNVKYSMDNSNAFRFAYFKSISRPNYFELVPYNILVNGYREIGNPQLDRVHADNLDLRYEYFPNSEDAVMAGVFYKYLANPIERSLIGTNAAIDPFFKNINSRPATNYGLELNLIKYFGHFGLSANYTFTHSTISEVKKKYFYVRQPDGTFVLKNEGITENRPLQGQSAHVANATFLYRDLAHKFNLDLSFLFQGRRIDQTSPDYGKDIYQQNFYSLSFSGDKSLGKRITLFAKVDNITNAPFVLYTKSGSPVQKDTFGQDYLLGLKIKLY